MGFWHQNSNVLKIWILARKFKVSQLTEWDIFGIFSNNVKSFLLEFKLQNHKNPRQFLIIKQKLQNLPNAFLQLSWRADWTAQPFLHWSFSHSIFNSLHWAPISKVREDANSSSTFYKTRFSFKLSLSWISLLHLFGTQWAKIHSKSL